MHNWIYSVSAAAAVCAICAALIPEGRMKKASSFVFAAVMLTAMLAPISELDFRAYSISAEKYRLQAESIVADGNKAKENLDRRYIEGKYAAYILDKAAQEGIELHSVSVSCSWSTEDFWYPESVVITASGNTNEEKYLSIKNAIEAELGIDVAHQQWSTA